MAYERVKPTLLSVYAGPRNLGEGGCMKFMKLIPVKLLYHNQLNARW